MCLNACERIQKNEELKSVNSSVHHEVFDLYLCRSVHVCVCVCVCVCVLPCGPVSLAGVCWPPAAPGSILGLERR